MRVGLVRGWSEVTDGVIYNIVEQGSLIDPGGVETMVAVGPAVDKGWIVKAGTRDLLPPPPPDPGVLQRALVDAVQRHLDDVARGRNYDGILSLCSYAASTSPVFGPEGLAGVAWRDSVWAHCYQVLADVQQGLRAVPAPEELIAELPEFTWGA